MLNGTANNFSKLTLKLRIKELTSGLDSLCIAAITVFDAMKLDEQK